MPRSVRTNPCAAPDCGQPVPAPRLMCRAHWAAVPEALRIAIMTSARKGCRADYLANVREAERLLAGHAAMESANA